MLLITAGLNNSAKLRTDAEREKQKHKEILKV